VDRARRIADAVLYEGYILWPYRRSALKNTRRWTFGGVHPARWSAAHPDDASAMQTQCLLEAPGQTAIDVRLRFLHVVARQVLRRGAVGWLPVDELEAADGQRWLTWDEAAERELELPSLHAGPGTARIRCDVTIPEGLEREEVAGRAGALERTWQRLEATVELACEHLGPQRYRVTVRVENTTPFAGADREDALRRTLVATHAVLAVPAGGFVSLTDPPGELREEAAACANIGTWPVLAGEEGERDLLLSSPIILPDHPQIAPESPGDLFDGGEIDQLLVLNILSLTDAEKAEMRATDPRAREILDRTAALSEEELMRLHGAIREFGTVRDV
jgi:hypothetical protein